MEDTTRKPSSTTPDIFYLLSQHSLLVITFHWMEELCVSLCLGRRKLRQKKNSDHHRKGIHAIKVQLSGFINFLDYLGQGKMDRQGQNIFWSCSWEVMLFFWKWKMPKWVIICLMLLLERLLLIFCAVNFNTSYLYKNTNKKFGDTVYRLWISNSFSYE